MGFLEALKVCFRKYFDFDGRASRSEYWFFYLWTVLIGVVAVLLDSLIFPVDSIKPLDELVTLIFFFPSLAVFCRRLHDINKSGWWQLILYFLPIIGWIILGIWLLKPTKES